ncbi:MAG: T9SS type A sorting domain-containing protein, partial [Bacteroidales bacterium]|nr:T9SS type A sorting domain-containing protein [Bacteroidales bacterium]
TEETSLELTGLMPGDYYISVTESLANCQDNEHIVVDFVNIIISETTSYRIYPNPTSDIIYMEFENETPQNIELLNSLGEVVTNQKPTTLQTSLNIDTFAPGTYFIRLYYINSIITHKIVLK